jgi:hypothetical protein
MREIIKITKDEVKVGEIEMEYENVLIDINCGILQGVYTIDYIIQCLRKHQDMPSKFSIADKLKKAKEQNQV